jgi:hypothetical protein
MRFGFVLPNNWGIDDVVGVVDLARRAEDAGYDSVWVNHHLLNVGYVGDRLDGRPYHDALTVLTWAAASTSRVELGTSVLVIAYLNPFVLAKAFATLDQLSQGRVRCGIGVGSLPEENDAVGVVPYGERNPAPTSSSPCSGRSGTMKAAFEPLLLVRTSQGGPKPWRRRVPIAVGGNRPPACAGGWAGDCWRLGVGRRGAERAGPLDALLAGEADAHRHRDLAAFDVPRT